MTGFILKTSDNIIVRFNYYLDEAPVTCKAFDALLPFTRVFKHARVSGQEIWIDNAPSLNIIQENASVFTFPGEAVYGPQNPSRAKTSNCMGIYYSEGRGLDACNIFAKVVADDAELLKIVGESIWKDGEQGLVFERM
ncbi:MAG: DUF3830 family protein [Mucilaginibacter sp.]